MNVVALQPLPRWFKQDLPDSRTLGLWRLLSSLNLHSVCQEAKCPNQSDCFKQGEVTFLILGDTCTRGCSFCNVGKIFNQGCHCEGASPKQSQKRDCFFGLRPHRNDRKFLGSEPLSLSLSREPIRISEAVKQLGLRYVVITSVTRDDLADGGAAQFARTISAIKAAAGDTRVEVLLPDFQGRTESLATVLAAGPFVAGHNIETIERLYPAVRPQADYRRSLGVLCRLKNLNPAIFTKSALILGLGEEEGEVLDAMRDIGRQGCDILVLGQYLAPSPRHYPVREFISPEQFNIYRERALALGFRSVLSGPKARSSYRAEEVARCLI